MVQLVVLGVPGEGRPTWNSRWSRVRYAAPRLWRELPPATAARVLASSYRYVTNAALSRRRVPRARKRRGGARECAQGRARATQPASSGHDVCRAAASFSPPHARPSSLFFPRVAARFDKEALEAVLRKDHSQRVSNVYDNENKIQYTWNVEKQVR